MCDDLNTPNAISVLYGELKNGNQLIRTREIDIDALSLSYGRIRDYLKVLGIRAPYVELGEEGKELYRAYDAAKADKNFAKSDEIRAKLIEKGWF